MDHNGRNVMYHLKPVFEPTFNFQSTSSMYKLKNMIGNSISPSNNSQASNSSEGSKGDDEKIVTRQETLLANLHQLQKDVSAFGKKLKELKIGTKAVKQDNIELSDKAGIPDFVINADPNYPPYALLWLRKLWNLPLKVTIHLHSSIQSLPGHLLVFDHLKSNSADSKHPNMTLVWKEVGEDVQLVVSPIKYKTILGEVNALRFFDYILGPEESALQHIRKNETLDLVHRLNHTSGRDQQAILAQLQKRLGNEKWFCESVPTLVDAVVWSALNKLKINAMPESLKKYLISCSEFVGATVSS